MDRIFFVLGWSTWDYDTETSEPLGKWLLLWHGNDEAEAHKKFEEAKQDFEDVQISATVAQWRPADAPAK